MTQPAAPALRPWTLRESLGMFLMPPLALITVFVFGLFLGLEMIPIGDWSLTFVLAVALVVVVTVHLRMCHVRGYGTGFVFAAVVGLGVLGWGHYVAYDWNGGDAVARIYERRGEDIKGLSQTDLRTRWIRETLGEPTTGAGPWDMLRARARAGIDARLRRPRRIVTREGWELWLGWAGQIVIVMAGAGAGAVCGVGWTDDAREKRRS